MTMQTRVDAVDGGSLTFELNSSPEIDRLIGKLAKRGVVTLSWLFLCLEAGDEICTRRIRLAWGLASSSRRSRQIERLSDSLANCLFEGLRAAVDDGGFGNHKWLSYVSVRPRPGRKYSRIESETTGLIPDCFGPFVQVRSRTP